MSLRLFSWPDLHGAEFLMHDVRQVVVFLLTLHHLLVQANSELHSSFFFIHVCSCSHWSTSFAPFEVAVL